MTRTRDLSLFPSAIAITGANNDVLPQVDAVSDLGAPASRWVTIYGESTSAQYADLAERYEADADYPVGTILIIGGDKEVTITDKIESQSVAGIVSGAPAFMMNDNGQDGHWPFIALAGRVPCRVTGSIMKGDIIGTSFTPGVGTSLNDPHVGAMVGIAMEEYHGADEGIIEVMVKSG